MPSDERAALLQKRPPHKHRESDEEWALWADEVVDALRASEEKRARLEDGHRLDVEGRLYGITREQLDAFKAQRAALLDYAKVIEWLWAERHDLGGPHRNGVHLSDFPPGLADIFDDALKRAHLGRASVHPEEET